MKDRQLESGLSCVCVYACVCVCACVYEVIMHRTVLHLKGWAVQRVGQLSSLWASAYLQVALRVLRSFLWAVWSWCLSVCVSVCVTVCVTMCGHAHVHVCNLHLDSKTHWNAAPSLLHWGNSRTMLLSNRHFFFPFYYLTTTVLITNTETNCYSIDMFVCAYAEYTFLQNESLNHIGVFLGDE